MPAKIILVEDQPIIAMSILSLLKNTDFQAERVASGEEIVKKLKEQDADLIIMDIRLDGGMDGIATAREIRKFSDIPIIFMSGSLLSYLTDIKQISNTYKISKPIDFKELQGLINTVTGIEN